MEHNNYNDNILDSYESTENALMDSFKAAALKVTTLYKDSLVQNRKAYAAGYQQALQDLYEFISTQPENGYIPVQDVLAFARTKNSQLTSEMGGNHSSTSSSNHTTPNNNTTTAAPATASSTTTSNTRPQQHIEEQHHPKANPFSIDPHAQFTFTHDLPIPQQQPMSGLWDQAINTSEANSGNKRRLNTDVTFMGRSMNLLVDNWNEQIQSQQPPPFKRTRSRHEQQQLIQLQQQQQQIQQQQQQLQIQQQQLQQLQQFNQQQQQQHPQ